MFCCSWLSVLRGTWTGLPCQPWEQLQAGTSLHMALGELGAVGSEHMGQGQGQLPRVCSSSSQMTFSCPTTAAPRAFICHQESSLFPSKRQLELQPGLLQALTFHDNNLLFSCCGPGSGGAVFRERCLCCADSTGAKHAPEIGRAHV